MCYVIKDAEGQAITMDDFLFLPDWTRTIVSKTQETVLENQRPQLHVTLPLAEGTTIPEKSTAQKAVEKPNAKIAAAREKKDKLNAAKTTTKHAGEEDSAAPRRKRVWKNQEIDNSGSEGTISITPLRQASPKPVEEGVSSAPKATAGTVAGETHPVNTEKEVVELSENTHLPTPPVINATQPSSHARTGPSPDGVAFSNGDVQLEELNRLRDNLRREMLKNNGLTKQLSLLETIHLSCPDREHELMDQLKEVKKERDDWRSEYRKIIAIPVGLCYTAGWLGGLSLGKTKDQIAPILSETRNLDIKGSKTRKDNHRELFTKQCPFIQKVVDSYRLPIEALLQVSFDLPSAEASIGPPIRVNTETTGTQAPRTE
ncbi:hypothetical protein Tco_0046242 [Tanacetum coccineum]